MYALLTFTKVLPENINQFKPIFKQEFLPVIQQQKGLYNIFWLEPTDRVEDFILLTQWQNKEYAETYLNGPLYKELMVKIQEFLVKEPVVKTYNFEKVMEGVPTMVK